MAVVVVVVVVVVVAAAAAAAAVVVVKQFLYRSWGFQEFEASRFQDIRHMLVGLSALRTGRPYPRKYSWYSYLLEAESSSSSK